MTIRCPNCGAEIDAQSTKCPYCGYINEKGAEKKYMDNLYEVKKNLDGIDEEAASGYKESYRKVSKMIVITFAILIAATAVILVIYNIHEKRSLQRDLDSGNKTLEEMTWKQEAYKEFDELYEAGKYEELCETFFDSYESGHSVYSYDHYTFVELYNDYLRTRTELENVEKYGWDDYASGIVFYYCCTFYFTKEERTETFYGLKKEDLENLEPVFDYMKDVLNNRLMISDEELEALSDKLLNRFNHLEYDACTKYAREHKDTFR
ncbi:MAG: zinc-ribbon domain-containing protein [Lachnospiraceae bacterium]|nr:zinc-ribbon domain-containing protein [Lachnospiraceae bacterium]